MCTHSASSEASDVLFFSECSSQILDLGITMRVGVSRQRIALRETTRETMNAIEVLREGALADMDSGAVESGFEVLEMTVKVARGKSWNRVQLRVTTC